jgi:hypothetical protein
MSQENLEVVRRAYDEFLTKGELPLPLCHPEIRVDNIPESPIPGPYFGHHGLRKWHDAIADVLPGFQITLEEVFDVGDDRVVGVVKFVGASSNPAGLLIDEMPSWAIVHWVRDGLVLRTAGFLTKDAALEAVGLRE